MKVPIEQPRLSAAGRQPRLSQTQTSLLQVLGGLPHPLSCQPLLADEGVSQALPQQLQLLSEHQRILMSPHIPSSAFFVCFGGHTWRFLELIPGSVLIVGLEAHIKYWGSNPGQLSTRQMPFLLSFLTSPHPKF